MGEGLNKSLKSFTVEQMLMEFFLGGLAVAALLMILGWFSIREGGRGTHFLVGGALVLIILGLFAVVDGNGLEVKNGEPCLNYTDEYSHVWNCTNMSYDCFGTPKLGSCWAYNETQCTDIDGCTWDAGQSYCSGTPEWSCNDLWIYGGEEKCLETDGCYIWEYTEPHTCDNYITYYYYQNCTAPVATEDFNYSQLIGVVLMLVGVGTMLGIMSWSKTEDLYSE